MTSESSPRASGRLGPAPERRGEFVRLRPLKPDDAQITLTWRMGERARLLNSGAATVEDQARWIGSRPSDEFNYVIELKEGAPVGMLSLVGIDLTNSRAESARFLIGDEEAAKGAPVAVEAMKLLYEIAFDELGLQRIHGLVAEPNTLMIKWQKYLGMREEGRLRRHYFIDGAFVDAIALGLLEDEYRRVTTPRMKALMQMGRAPKGSA
jgi:RimJ/RimL family protein N-acetyltransferase